MCSGADDWYGAVSSLRRPTVGRPGIVALAILILLCSAGRPAAQRSGTRLPPEDVSLLKSVLARTGGDLDAAQLALQGSRSDLAVYLRHGTLDDAQSTLFRMRDDRLLTQEEMLATGRVLEPRLRSEVMKLLRVRDSRTDPLAIERGGTSPVFGRGVFSDEDLQTKTLEQYHGLETMRNAGHSCTLRITLQPQGPG